MYKDREKKKKKHQDLYTSQTGSTLRLVLTFRPEAVAFNSTTDAPVRVKKYSVHFIFITFFFFFVSYYTNFRRLLCVCV